MATITVFQRHEKKFLMEESVMRRLLPQIKEHMEADKHCLNGMSYPISNLYFDTVGDDVIRDSLQKPFYKEKLRMRCYGIPQSDSSRVFLELKKKVNKVVTKRRAKLTYGEAKRFLRDRTYPDTDDYMTRQVLREIEYYLSHKEVHPCTRISYDRYAFFDKEDDSFRLTFDKNIFYLRAEEGENIDFQDRRRGHRVLPDHFRLMEVKVSNAYPLWFVKLLQEDGVNPVSFSKYGVSYKNELLHRIDTPTEHYTILSHI